MLNIETVFSFRVNSVLFSHICVVSFFRDIATTEQSVSVISNPSLGSAHDVTPASPSPSTSLKDKGSSRMQNKAFISFSHDYGINSLNMQFMHNCITYERDNKTFFYLNIALFCFNLREKIRVHSTYDNGFRSNFIIIY